MGLINISIGAGSAAPSLWSTVSGGLIVALGAGIILFLLNWLREWLTASLNRKTQAEVLAFSLVTEIDRLIAACADVVDDPLHMDNNSGVWDTTVPSPWVEFPDSWNWGSFPTKLQYRIRTIPNKINLANRSVSSIWEYGEGPPDYSDAIEERTFRFALIGLEAVQINGTLAREYNVPLLDRGEWDPEERFTRDIDRISKKRDLENANPRPTPAWMQPTVPIEDLEKRFAKLTADLSAAQQRQKANLVD